MKVIILLFFTLVISSCGRQTEEKQATKEQSKKKKAVCQAFDDIEICTKKTELKDIETCSLNAIQDASQKMQGDQLTVSSTQRTKYVENVVFFSRLCSFYYSNSLQVLKKMH